TLGMMVILEQLWARVIANYAQRRRTWIFIDEFHLLFRNAYSAAFFADFYKRARKYGATPTGITQDTEELLHSHEARLMLANCEYLYLLGQSETNQHALAELLSLSQDQLAYIGAVPQGTGLLRAGSRTVAIDQRM